MHIYTERQAYRMSSEYMETDQASQAGKKTEILFNRKTDERKWTNRS